MIPDLLEAPRQPFTSAPLTLVVAEQGGGKSTFATARPVEDTFKRLTSIILPNGYEVEASPALNEKGKAMVGWATIYFPHKEPFVAPVPEGSCCIAEKVRIFTNYTLFGIRHAKCSLADILEHLNDDVLLDGWIVIDEAYIGADARNSMNLLNQIITQFGFQIRKRRLHLIVCYPLNKMADLRFRLARTEYVTCTYNEKTHEVTAEIKKGKDRKKIVTFDATIYWPYFNTEERFAIPESRIAKGLQQAY
jgi:hypothetical protein